MAFKKNKRQNIVVSAFALLALSSGIFLLTPSSTHADTWGAVGSVVSAATGGDNFIVTGFKFLLLGIFTMVGWIASVAVTIFGWAVNPDYISGSGGLLNRASVYTMWQFVRDFFNLFFILTLLYTAFTIVFQVASNYKKTLLSIVLAALFVNFSFPITRVIIDVTNVPMYYFVNQIAAQTGGEQNNWLGTVLSASQIKDVLIPGAGNGGSVSLSDTTVSQLIMAIVFLFIFSITLLILAVLFVVRVAGLLILLIFSSVGFAASVIPGLEEYGSKWWKKLWEYSIFGPAAMLMLFVATSFFKEISADNTRAQFLQAGISNSVPEQAGFISAMAMFTIPIIMLWMAIALAGSSAIAGAGAITGKGKQFGKWLAKNNPVSYPTRKFATGVGKGVKSRFEDSSIGKSLARPSGIESFGKATAKGLGKESGWQGGFGVGTAFRNDQAGIRQKLVNEQVKKNKENQVSDSEHIKNLSSGDIVEREAAALSLAESKGIRNAETLAAAIKAVGNNQDAVLKILDSARSEALGSMDGKNHSAVMDSFYEKDPNTGAIKTDAKGRKMIAPKMKDAYDSYNGKLKKEGQLKVRVDYEINEKAASGMNEAQAKSETYSELIEKLSSDDLAKQGSIHAALKEDASLKAYLKEKVSKDPQYYQEAYKKMSQADREKWKNEGISPEGNGGKQTDNGAALRAKIQGLKKENGR